MLQLSKRMVYECMEADNELIHIYRRMHRYLYHPAVAVSRPDGFPASSATRMACATVGLGPFDACRAS
jgi:hypothetical protein